MVGVVAPPDGVVGVVDCGAADWVGVVCAGAVWVTVGTVWVTVSVGCVCVTVSVCVSCVVVVLAFDE